MKSDYIIIGNSSFSIMIYKYMREEGSGNVLAFVADAEYITDREYDGIPIIDFTELFDKYDKNIKLIMGIGYSQMATIREQKYRLCKDKGFSFGNYIHSSARVHSTAKLGEGNVIFEDADIQADAVIGNCNLFLADSLFGHDSVAGDFNTFCIKSVITGYVEIKNHCFIGTLSTMNNNIVVNDYTFIGATAYASRSTKRNTVVIPSKCKYLVVDEGGYMI